MAAASLAKRSLIAGAAGTVGITVSSTVEMKLRGRPPSEAPIKAIENVVGRRLPARKLIGNVSHVVTGLALGVPRAALERAGVREPTATLAFVPVAWLPDLVAVPALGAADPPWKWGNTEVVISLVHHVAYAVAAGAALASWPPSGENGRGDERARSDTALARDGERE